jgi:hypothetical protein
VAIVLAGIPEHPGGGVAGLKTDLYRDGGGRAEAICVVGCHSQAAEVGRHDDDVPRQLRAGEIEIERIRTELVDGNVEEPFDLRAWRSTVSTWSTPLASIRLAGKWLDLD